MHRRSGVTFIELVVLATGLAVALTIAVLGAPLVRIAKNETAAVRALRELAAANEVYRTRSGEFAPSLVALVQAPDLETETLEALAGEPEDEGFELSYESSGGTFSARAEPIAVGGTGVRHFFIDATGVVRASAAGSASSRSAAID